MNFNSEISAQSSKIPDNQSSENVSSGMDLSDPTELVNPYNADAPPTRVSQDNLLSPTIFTNDSPPASTAVQSSNANTKKRFKGRKKQSKSGSNSNIDPHELKDLFSDQLGFSDRVLTLPAEFKSKIRLTMLEMVQAENPTHFLPVTMDPEKYNEMFSLAQNLAEVNLIQNEVTVCMNELAVSLSAPEVHRRFNSLQSQLEEDEQALRFKLMTQSQVIASGPVEKILHKLKISEAWPVFNDAQPGEWQTVNHLIFELGNKRRQELNSWIPENEQQKRLTMIYAMSETNKRKLPRLFEQDVLKKFLKQGVAVPLLIQIGDDFELMSTAIKWDQLTERELRAKAIHIFHLLKGVVFVRGQKILLEPLNWPNSAVRMLILEHPEYSMRFQDRLRTLADFGQTQIASLSDLAELSELGAKEKVLHEELISMAESLASAHFGIPMNSLAQMKNLMGLELPLRLDIDSPASQNLHVVWPNTASEEMEAQIANYKDFFAYFGYSVVRPTSTSPTKPRRKGKGRAEIPKVAKHRN